jgi:hypothetical protein
MPMSDYPRESVLWPRSRCAAAGNPLAPRARDLNEKTICELWDVIFRGETIYPLVREYIRARYPRVKFVDYTHFGNFYGAREEDNIATRLPQHLKAHKADAAIVGIGA